MIFLVHQLQVRVAHRHLAEREDALEGPGTKQAGVSNTFEGSISGSRQACRTIATSSRSASVRAAFRIVIVENADTRPSTKKADRTLGRFPQHP